MADALLGTVIGKLASLIKNEFSTLYELREKAKKLSDTLTPIRAVLEGAEERDMTDRGSAVMIWLQQLKDAAYVLDDILEDCSSESLQHGGSSSVNPMNIVFSREVGRKLDEMMERLNEIDQNKNMYGLREGVVRERPSGVAKWRETSSILPSRQVCGREEDKKKVVDFLRSPALSSDDSLSVYSIVGFGGLGKTTLAQMIFNDQSVRDHFDTRIWVCVSENFTKKGILCSIIEHFLEDRWEVSNLNVMERKVQNLLQGKRYLLVLDDVWRKSQKLEEGVSQKKWEELQSVLHCGSEGASILVSTRDMDVAAIMGTCQVHQLSVLSGDDCWLLFQRYAFGPDQEGNAELVAIGKEIVKKCGGSPLAAKALGSLLRYKSKKEWLEVERSKLWTIPDEGDILPALRLSYFYLTPTLKQCFAFCAIFPKDEEIKKQDLIYLWMANEFISPRKNLEVEEVGNVIWNELYQKSFFQDVRIDDLGDIYFKMHDLVHDLAQSITKQECIYMEEINTTFLPGNTHHLCFRVGVETLNQAVDRFESLRTVFQVRNFGPQISRWQLPTSVRVLRAKSLDLSLLGNLIHLRYLDLNNLDIRTLHVSIYNLRRLQILKLSRCWNLRCLPRHLTGLKNLRHLIIERCDSLSRLFPNIHKLSDLRTLSVYIVRTQAGHSLAELRNLNLGGQLSIRGLENVGSLSEAQEANLKGKEDLRQLSLSWERRVETNSYDTDDALLLEALQPHQNLKALSIKGYKGVDVRAFPSLESLKLQSLPNLERLQSFPHLSYLYVSRCPRLRLSFLPCVKNLEVWEGNNELLQSIPSLSSLDSLILWEDDDLTSLPEGMMNNLTNLKTLQISQFRRLKKLPYEITQLSALESLKIENCYGLQSLPERGLEGLRSLRTLEISSCGGLRSLPDGVQHLTSLEALNIWNCPALEKRCKEGTGEDWHKIKHIPRVTLLYKQ